MPSQTLLPLPLPLPLSLRRYLLLLLLMLLLLLNVGLVHGPQQQPRGPGLRPHPPHCPGRLCCGGRSGARAREGVGEGGDRCGGARAGEGDAEGWGGGVRGERVGSVAGRGGQRHAVSG